MSLLTIDSTDTTREAGSEAIYRRYVNDPTTTERELHEHSGQAVTILNLVDPDSYDSSDIGAMYDIRFADGFEAQAFADELDGMPTAADDPKVENEETALVSGCACGDCDAVCANRPFKACCGACMSGSPFSPEGYDPAAFWSQFEAVKESTHV